MRAEVSGCKLREVSLRQMNPPIQSPSSQSPNDPAIVSRHKHAKLYVPV